jgi:ABC-2 type transport system permease protein
MDSNRITRAIAKYWAILCTQVINGLAYPGDLFSRSLSIVLYLFIFVQLWQATYRSAGQTAIAGLTLRDTLWYLMLAETIILSKPRFASRIAQAVKDGSIAYLLNKPYNLIIYQLCTGLADSLLHAVPTVILGSALTWVAMGPPPPVRGWPLTFVAVVLAWLIDFCLSAVIGLSAFVTEDVAAFEWVYQKLLFILGGMLIPLDFFPAWVQRIALSLPFAYTVYGPARLFVEPSWARFVSLAGAQLLWLAILGGAAALAYRWCERRLTINGG